MALRTSKLYIAVDSGVAEVDGRTYTFTAGVTRIPGGHPLLRKNSCSPNCSRNGLCGRMRDARSPQSQPVSRAP
jgi:hypothetical protein